MMAKYRYPGTEPFSTDDKDIFFGRDEDIQQLYQAILLEQITVLHGKSGYGKTSLLRAGILPLLDREENLQAIYVRPGRYNPNEGVGIIEKFIQKAFADKLPSSALLEELDGNNQSLWYYFKSLQIENPDLSGFVIILDQFEECFSYTPFQLEAFKQELSELLFVKLPQEWREKLKKKLKENPDQYTEEVLSLFYAPINIKVVFSIRSDKLSLMDQFKNYFPNILQNNYVLDALKRRQASMSITQPARLPGKFRSPLFEYTEKALDKILSFLASKINQSVEAFQLQMVCQYIEMYLIGPDKTLVQESDLDHLDDIVENFYDKQIERLGDKSNQELARAMMEKLIFEEDLQRISLYEKQIFKELSITPELLNKMVECRLVRAEVSSSTGATMYEITHDTLVLAVVKSKKRKQQATLYDKMVEKSKLQQQVNTLEKKWKEELEQIDIRIRQYQKDNFNEGLTLPKDGSFPVVDKHLSYLYYQRGYLYSNMKWYDKAFEDYDRAIRFDPDAAYLYNSRGIIYFDTRKYKEAIQNYLKAIELDGNQAYYYTNTGLAYEKLEDFDQAAFYYNEAVQTDDSYADAYNSRGNIHYHREDYQKAELDYLRALDLDPENAVFLRNLGSNMNKLGLKDKAMAYFEKAISLNPDFADAYNSRGNIFYDQEKYDEANSDYTKAIELKGSEAIFHRNLGLVYERLGDQENAIEAYSAAIEWNPSYSDAYNSRGNIFYEQKKYEEAIANYEKAIELNGAEGMYHRNLGLAYERTSHSDKAITAYEKAIQANPSYSEAYNSLANIYYDQQDYETAIANYQKAIEFNDNEAVFYRNMGLSLEKSGKKEESLQSYERAIELNPDYAEAYNSRGNILYGLERFEEAIDNYKKAIKLDAGEGIFHRNLGLSYEKIGETEKALSCYNKAIELNPTNTDAFNSRANLFFYEKEYGKAKENYEQAIRLQPGKATFYRNLGATFEELGQADNALDHYNKAIELDPKYVDGYNTRGIFFHKQGKYERAIEDLNHAIAIDENEASIWRNLGLSYQSLENHEKALDCFENAIRLSPNLADPYNDIANIYYNYHGDYNKSLEFYKKAVALNPEELVFLANMASNYVLTDDIDAALTTFDEAIKINPNDPSLYIQRGGVYQDFIKNIDKALADYEKAISLEPEEELLDEIYRNKVELYAGLKEVEKATHFLELVEQSNKADSFYYFLRAKVAAARGDKELFYDELQQSLDTKPVHRFFVYLDKDQLLQPFLEEERFRKMVEAFKNAK